jgi:hypothetical protein
MKGIGTDPNRLVKWPKDLSGGVSGTDRSFSSITLFGEWITKKSIAIAKPFQLASL